MINFFNAIGVADMEKVHSAMIAWILDDKNDQMLHSTSSGNSQFTTFYLPIRSEFLCELFQVKPIKQFKSIQTQIEWNDIDIMVETEDRNGTKEIWVIENKLKSLEHQSKDNNGSFVWQTNKYENIIAQEFPHQIVHYLLLSLGGDKAKSPSGVWQSSTYSSLFAIIKKHLGNNPNSYSLIDEYARAIEMTTSELGKFLGSRSFGKEYPHVFAKQKKSVKMMLQRNGQITNQERYIIENGLETIFQKQLLAKMIACFLPSIMNGVEYDERNGTAMFVYHVANISDFKLIIEFQGGTYKVGLLHKDYKNSSSYVHTNRLYNNINVINVFQNLAIQNGWKVANAKNLKQQHKQPKPRIALDKNIGKGWYDNPNNAFVTVFHEAEKLADYIKNHIKTIP